MEHRLLHEGGEAGHPRGARRGEVHLALRQGGAALRAARHRPAPRGGLLPKYRLLVEKLAQKGLLKVIVRTDTLGVGVNIPISYGAVHEALQVRRREDGHPRRARLPADQRARGAQGLRRSRHRRRAGARARDREPAALQLRCWAATRRRRRRFALYKSRPRRATCTDKATFDRLVTALPEPLVSRFSASHGMLLNVLSRPKGGCGAMKRLIKGCHDTRQPEEAARAHGVRDVQVAARRGHRVRDVR